jgi:heme/copper-type cytochrome/quinol oxidase subunit 2
MSEPTHRFAAPLKVAIALAAVIGLAACGSSSSSSSATTATTTALGGASTTADELTPTSAAPKAADVTAGKATIDVKVGTDDFTTSGGTRVVSVPKGTAVTINLTSADAEQYHLHGYDIEEKADPGQTATFQFTADQTGQFDLESHVTEKTLLVLVVQ